MNWNKMKVKDFAQVISGGTPSTKIVNYWEGDIYWITPKDLSGYKARFISHGERNISEEGLLNSSARLLPKNTVLLTTRAPIGYVAISENELATNQGFKNLICNEEIAHFEFVYYMLKNSKELLESHATGSTFKELPSERLKEIYLPIPPINIQNRIASILSVYDSLIENNRRRIQLLEQSAQLLYREWFIYLRFPGHEHVRIIDGVPEGWKTLELSDVCSDIRETVKPEQVKSDTPYIGLEHMPRKSITLMEWGKSEQVTSNKFKYRKGDILFGKIRPYFHKVGLTFTDGITSSDAIVIRSKNQKLAHLLLMVVSSDHFVAVTSKTVREGSKMPRADWKVLRKYQILVPPHILLENFNEIIRSITSQLEILSFQIHKLQQARDSLLPRLMNGEITV